MKTCFPQSNVGKNIGMGDGQEFSLFTEVNIWKVYRRT
jgi:hypothetical protein